MKKINNSSVLAANAAIILIKGVSAFSAFTLTVYMWWTLCGMLPQGPNFGLFCVQLMLVTVPMLVIGIVTYLLIVEGIVRGVITVGNLLSKD